RLLPHARTREPWLSVVVTGSTRGIGKAMTLAYARAGADVVVTGTKASADDSDSQAVGTVARAKPRYCQVDFDDASSSDAFLKLLSDLPRLDVLENNAGINRITLIGDVSRAEYESVMNVNLH